MVEQTEDRANLHGWRQRGSAIPAAFPLDAPLAFASAGLLVLDALVTLVAALLAHFVRFGDFGLSSRFVAIALVAAVLMPGLTQLLGGYEFRNLRQLLSSTRKAWLSWAIVVSALLGLAFFGKVSSDFSRGWAASWLGMAFAGFFIARALLVATGTRFASNNSLSTRIAVVNLDNRYAGIRKGLEALYGSNIAVGQPYSLDPDVLMEDIRANKIDLVLIPVSAGISEGVTELLDRLRSMAVKVFLLPEVPEVGLRVQGAALLGSQMALEVVAPPLDGRRYYVKSASDWVIALLATILALPVMAVIAAAIKINSPGPVIFRQKRNGLNNKEIEVFKFRTMGDAVSNALSFQQATLGDPRITRVGRFLRRTSLDELPQLFNVLRGDLALIGPRPHAVEHNKQFDKVIGDFASRHRVKPGITGWAQVNGWRGPTDTSEKMKQRVEHDLHYIEQWSLGLDLKILLLTLRAVIRGNNAH